MDIEVAKLCFVAASADIAHLSWLIASSPSKINMKGPNDQTALHFAAFQGRYSNCELLIAKGANIHATDNEGWTPLHCAANGQAEHADGQFEEIFALLLRSGARIDSRDNNGETPLLGAASNCLFEICKFLVNHGASMTLADNNGFTPKDWAVLRKQKRLVDLFSPPTDVEGIAGNNDTTRAGVLFLNTAYDSISDLITRTKYSEALPIVEKVLSRNPEDPMFLGQKALILEGMNDFDGTKQCYQLSLSIDDSSATRLRNFALLLDKEKSFEEAEVLYVKALVLEPSNDQIMAELGDLYESMLQKAKAKDFYKRALDINPENFLAKNNLHAIEFRRAVRKGEMSKISNIISEQISSIERASDTNSKARQAYSAMSMAAIQQRMKEGKPAYPCGFCGKEATSKCSKCGVVRYCSRECQISAWTRHKIECGPLSHLVMNTQS
jgi:tetratricopeptide (TPR) repeat protein